MASIRRRLRENVNSSKNTRMDIAAAGVYANWRPDELAHISRYCKIAELIQSEAARIGRPLDCLEVGCGQIWALRFLYKATLCTKAEQVREYLGYDIDPAVLEEFWTDGGGDVNDSAWFRIFNGHVAIQDVTVNPVFEPSSASDGLYDFFWSTEVIEHMKPALVEPWIASVAAQLRPGGLGYVSTPNSDGSRERLPKDHFYEWGFDELRELLSRHFKIVSVDGVFIQMPKFNKARQAAPERCPDQVLEIIERRFDPHWRRVILAAFYPEVANNCAWTLRKRLDSLET